MIKKNQKEEAKPITRAAAAKKYSKIRKQIEEDRLHAWSSAPTFTIGKFEVCGLTFRSQTDLQLCRNALVVGKKITDGDVAAYIWRHHNDFGDELKRKEFVKKISKVKNKESLILDCMEHFLSAFQDSPSQQTKFGGTQTTSNLPAIPAIAHLCDEYGSEYGVEPMKVADIDLRIVFQAIRAIRIRNNGSKYLEPKKLREAKSEFLNANG